MASRFRTGSGIARLLMALSILVLVAGAASAAPRIQSITARSDGYTIAGSGFEPVAVYGTPVTGRRIATGGKAREALERLRAM